MQKLKTKFLYKFLLLLIINIYFNNIFLLLISLLYIVYENGKKSYIFITIISIVFLINLNRTDFIKYGFVDTKTDKYAIVNKILYKCKVYNNNLEVGDIVKTDNFYDNVNENDLKYNIIYINKNATKLGSNIIKQLIYKYIENKNYAALYKNIFYNIYDEDVADQYNNISFGLACYYLILLLFRKNKKTGLVFLVIYSLLFGFQIKFILIIIDFILLYLDFDRIESLLFKLFIIMIINKYLLLNYSFLLGILISVIFLFKDKSGQILIGIIQSYIFGEVKILNIVFYKAYIYEKISLFIFGTISLFFSVFEKPFLIYSNCLDKVFGLLSFSIRGSFGLFPTIIFIIIIKLFKLKNEYLKYILFLFLMIVPFNTLITHINFIDVGQGDSILIVDASSQETVLIDTGSIYNYSKLRKALYSEGLYKIDHLIITHDDSDHNGNVENLQKDFDIKEIVTEGKDIETKILLFKYLKLKDGKEDNDNSLVYLLNIDDYRVLFTGDLSSNIENDIIFKHNINDIDILKVSHHGSNTATSNYFVGNIKPEFAIISTSGQYGHPHKNVIDTLNKFSVKTYITKNDGSIKFYFTNLMDYIITSKFRFDIIFK